MQRTPKSKLIMNFHIQQESHHPQTVFGLQGMPEQVGHDGWDRSGILVAAAFQLQIDGVEGIADKFSI